MNFPLNEDIAGRLDELGRILASQGANHFRVQAYHHAADTLRKLPDPVDQIFRREGLDGLKRLPHIGETIARAIRDILLHGRLAMLERLRGESDPVALLRTVPGIGNVLAHQLHEDLGIETLEDLELAAHDGRLEKFPGMGAKRIAGIRDSLAHRLQSVRKPAPSEAAPARPPLAELLDVDREYREKAAAGMLKKIAPRRFNPKGAAWLPVLHTTRGPRHYTALFSNTAKAHRLGKTGDWVVLYYEQEGEEGQATVITAEQGPLRGQRIVPGYG